MHCGHGPQAAVGETAVLIRSGAEGPPVAHLAEEAARRGELEGSKKKCMLLRDPLVGTYPQRENTFEMSLPICFARASVMPDRNSAPRPLAGALFAT